MAKAEATPTNDVFKINAELCTENNMEDESAVYSSVQEMPKECTDGK